jgi:mono/diheme cytochrome c family protein
MRQSLVNRSVLILSGLFVGACMAFAWVVGNVPAAAPAAESPPPAAAADHAVGAALYAKRCARCHDFEEALAPLRAAPPGSDSRTAYLALLQRHRKSAAEENGPIIDYLHSRLAAGTE